MRLIRRLFHTAFHRTDSRLFVVTDLVLGATVIGSTLAVVLSSVARFTPYHELFAVIEYCALGIFTVEYLGRIIAAEKPLRYIVSIFGLIDLFAIIPAYIALLDSTVLKVARAAHVIRALQIGRIFKVFHMVERFHGRFRRYVSLEAVDALAYFLSLLSTVIFFGGLMVTFEGSFDPVPHDIPLAMWWVVQIILGMSAPVEPQTLWGEAFVIMTRLTGLLLFGFLVHLVGEYGERLIRAPHRRSPR